MAISTANAPKALAPGLGGSYGGGGDFPLQQSVVRDPMQAHNSLASMSRLAKLVPKMGRSNRHEAYHNDGGRAHCDDGGCAHCE